MLIATNINSLLFYLFFAQFLFIKRKINYRTKNYAEKKIYTIYVHGVRPHVFSDFNSLTFNVDIYI